MRQLHQMFLARLYFEIKYPDFQRARSWQYLGQKNLNLRLYSGLKLGLAAHKRLVPSSIGCSREKNKNIFLQVI